MEEICVIHHLEMGAARRAKLQQVVYSAMELGLRLEGLGEAEVCS